MFSKQSLSLVYLKPFKEYLKGRNFRGKKISRISRFLLKSAKLNSREIFQNRPSAKLNSRESFQNLPSAKLNSREIFQNRPFMKLNSCEIFKIGCL